MNSIEKKNVYPIASFFVVASYIYASHICVSPEEDLVYYSPLKIGIRGPCPATTQLLGYNICKKPSICGHSGIVY